MKTSIPELLAPAGSLDAVRAAIANGADAVYFGVERFNARDEAAQLTLDDLEHASNIARANGVRLYLTLNTLVKPGELGDALDLLGRAIDCGVSAAIVQDIGLIKLIQRVFPGFEIHGSTQMTVHDERGARLARELGLDRVVMARENTLEDLKAIRAAAPDLGIEAFVHGALCISYSGQCLMSGMISDRSANRGSCAQACRKDYVLRDAASGEELDRGFLISAKDLAAYDSLAELSELGVVSLKIEGRKKKPEYVATAAKAYRGFLDRVAQGDRPEPSEEDVRPLVQIYSRGFTSGMLRGRGGREYVTRAQPDNRGIDIGVVVAHDGDDLIIEVTQPLSHGDGLGFEPPEGGVGRSMGFAVDRLRALRVREGVTRYALASRNRVPIGWRVVRSSQIELLERARDSYAALSPGAAADRVTLSVRVFGSAGAPLKAVFSTGKDEVTAESQSPLSNARARALDDDRLREQFGRLGETPFTLGLVDARGLSPGLFLPVSELNHLRQAAVEEFLMHRDWADEARLADRGRRVASAIGDVDTTRTADAAAELVLAAEVYGFDDARAAARNGASEIVFDPFLRHPVPPVSRVRGLADELADSGILFRLRTPTIVRPEDRRSLEKWLAAGFPTMSGHVGLVCELARDGRNVVADYAVNCFNQHTAAELFARGVRRVTASVELTADELHQVVGPWGGAGFEVVVYGRPEGMTLEHCVLSAAFDREPTTCRDLCVQSHPVVSLTDATGYTFPVATDSDCRNRLLHSRPIEASEFLPRLWKSGIRAYRLLFNVPGDRVADLTSAYRATLDAIARGQKADLSRPRDIVGHAFTRGHFARPV